MSTSATSPRESVFTYLRSWSPQRLTLLALILLAGLLFRWLDLGARPLHHDESIHAMMSFYFYDAPDQNFYKYDPVYHGPLLYNIYRFVYEVFGATDWSARFPMALLGSLALLIPLAFRRYLTSDAVFASITALAISPTLAFWSRFAREDFYVIGGMLLTLGACTLASARWRIFLFALGFTIQFCSKANIFVHIAILLGFVCYSSLLDFIRGRKMSATYRSVFRFISTHIPHLVVALLVCLSIYVYLFSAGFRYDEGVFKGRFGGFDFWMGQHIQERIKGPFLFHIYQLSWYETPFMVLTLLHVFSLTARARGAMLWSAASWIATLVILSVLVGLEVIKPSFGEETFWNHLKIKDGKDLIGFVALVIYPIIVTTFHLLREERALALWGYFFGASLFTYSFLGEKVPWLSTYPMLGGILYFSLYFGSSYGSPSLLSIRRFPRGLVINLLSALLLLVVASDFLIGDHLATYQRVILLIFAVLLGVWGYIASDDNGRPLGIHVSTLVGALFFISIAWNVRTALLTIFPDKEREIGYISQVHTTREFKETALRIREEIESERNGFRPLVIVSGDPVWPLVWYFRQLPQLKYPPLSETDKEAAMFHIQDSTPETPDRFLKTPLKMRGWWVPDLDKMTWSKFLKYAWDKRPWSDIGYLNVELLVDKRVRPGFVKLPS